ncbi:hypothetical protein H0H93_003802, partial [Arthromyces matolae]
CLLSAILSIAIPAGAPGAVRAPPKNWIGGAQEIGYVSLGEQLVKEYKGLDEESSKQATMDKLDRRIGELYGTLGAQSPPTTQHTQGNPIWAQDVAEFATLLQLRHAQRTRSTSAINRATLFFKSLNIPENGKLGDYLSGLTIPN